jgi:hypothetical protein
VEREIEVVDAAGAVVPVLVSAGPAATVADLSAALGVGVPFPGTARLDEVHLPVDCGR